METEATAVPYTPNHIPVWTRVFYGLASAGLILYGAFGLWIDDLYIPGKRGPGTHLHGPAAWLMAAAMLMGSLEHGLGRLRPLRRAQQRDELPSIRQNHCLDWLWPHGPFSPVVCPERTSARNRLNRGNSALDGARPVPPYSAAISGGLAPLQGRDCMGFWKQLFTWWNGQTLNTRFLHMAQGRVRRQPMSSATSTTAPSRRFPSRSRSAAG